MSGFAIHICLGTTTNKVFILKTMLASVQTDLYTSDAYIYKFDTKILDTIVEDTNYPVDRINRTVQLLTVYIIYMTSSEQLLRSM